MGEWDRTNARLGKLSARFSLRVSHQFLSWARGRWREYGQIRAGDNPTAHQTMRLFKEMAKPQFERAEKTFPLLPWGEQVREIILREVLEQISLYRGNALKADNPSDQNRAPYPRADQPGIICAEIPTAQKSPGQFKALIPVNHKNSRLALFKGHIDHKSRHIERVNTRHFSGRRYFVPTL